MKFYTVSGSYFEVRTVNNDLHRVFYCTPVGFTSDKHKEELVTSAETFKRATKTAEQLKTFYDRGYHEGSY